MSQKISHLPQKKVLGKGQQGKVFLVEKDKQSYALKVEYILPSSKRKGGELHNELEFFQDVASFYPDKFIQLVDYEIVENCEQKLEKIGDFLPKGIQKHLEKARKGSVCVYKLYTLIDTDMNHLLDKMNRWSMNHKYSALLQLIDILRIMDNTGWVHGDFHPGNVGIEYTSRDKIVYVNKKPIKTYGTLFKSIDFGGLLHRDTLRPSHPYLGDDNETELKHYKDHLSADREVLLKMMYNEKPYWQFIGKYKIHLNYDEDLKKVKELKEFKKLRSLKKFRKLNDHLIFRMVHLLYPDIFEPLILGDKFKKVIGMNLRFPIEDVMYVFENFFENEKLIRHFLHLLNTKI